MGTVLQSSSRRVSIWDEHEAIAEAIAKGDCAGAAELSDLHTTHARENLISRLEETLIQK